MIELVWLYFCLTSIETALNPHASSSPSPKRVSFWTFPAEFSLLQLRFTRLVLEDGVVPRIWGFYVSPRLFVPSVSSSQNPLKPSPPLTIKDVPSPPPPTPPVLSWPPASVKVGLLCNFTSMLKIDRRLEQTMFRDGKQQNSYRMSSWLCLYISTEEKVSSSRKHPKCTLMEQQGFKSDKANPADLLLMFCLVFYHFTFFKQPFLKLLI